MLVANNKSELESVLKSIDISVPKRSSKRRTKEHTECYAIAHMLSTLLRKGQLSYPLELTRRERPDFLLKLNGLEIGIEHTEAVPQNKAQKTVLRDKVDGLECCLVSHHQPSEPKKTAQELREEIQANQGHCWAGDSVEREWSEAMLHFIQKKIESLAKNGFEKFKQNWLLIYDNWSSPALDREKGAQFLLPKAIETNCFDNFDDVYIITGNFLVEFSNVGIAKHKIHDLWE
jgi:hypothetical protein